MQYTVIAYFCARHIITLHTRSYELPVYGRGYTRILFSDFIFRTNDFCSTSLDAVPVSRYIGPVAKIINSCFLSLNRV